MRTFLLTRLNDFKLIIGLRLLTLHVVVELSEIIHRLIEVAAKVFIIYKLHLIDEWQKSFIIFSSKGYLINFGSILN